MGGSQIDLSYINPYGDGTQIDYSYLYVRLVTSPASGEAWVSVIKYCDLALVSHRRCLADGAV